MSAQKFNIFELLLAPWSFRAAYHAWRRYRGLQDEDVASIISQADEAKLLVESIHKAAALDPGATPDVGAFGEMRSYLETSAIVFALNNGTRPHLFQDLDKIIRNRTRRRGCVLHAWWRAGLNCAELDLCLQGVENKQIVEVQAGLVEALVSAGYCNKDGAQLFANSRDTDCLRTTIDNYFITKTPESFHPDLTRLLVQHAAGRFPDRTILKRLGCRRSGIAYLQLLYDRRPHPVKDDIAACELQRRENLVSFSSGAVEKRRTSIPVAVQNALIAEIGGNRLKAWRQKPTSKYSLVSS